jgi:hypothetical protein
LRLALSKGPNRVGVSLHLRTKRDPVSETSCFSSNYLESGRWTKSENPVILCAIHHRQNPIESTGLLHVAFEVFTEVVMKNYNFWALIFHAGFLLDLFFHPEDGGDMFLRIFGWLSMNYTALYPTRYNSLANFSMDPHSDSSEHEVCNVAYSIRTIHASCSPANST